MAGFEYYQEFYFTVVMTILVLAVCSIIASVVFFRIVQSRSDPNITSPIAALHPDPIWATSQNGGIIWQNKASKNLLADVIDDTGQMRKLDFAKTGMELICKHHKDIQIFYASHDTTTATIPQAISNTFAHLTTGIAVFDTNKTLSMFNPALLDLTNSSFETFSSKTDLIGFLDILRTQNILPEPRDYIAWRAQFVRFATSTEHGTFNEDWLQPDGRVLRVQGKPHSDKSTTLLFEDISPQVELNRSLRTELDIVTSILNTVEHSVVVFDPVGMLVFANKVSETQLGISHGAHLSLRSFFQTLFQSQADTIHEQFFQKHHNKSNLYSDRFGNVSLRSKPLAGRNTLIEIYFGDPMPNLGVCDKKFA